MKINITIVALAMSFFSYAQVGINTTEPQATLDVNGNLIVRNTPATPVSGTYDFLVVNSVSNEVQRLSGNFNSNASNPYSSTFAKAVEQDGLSLLDGSLFAGWQKIDFGSGHVPINPGGHFSATNDFYTIPSDGIYAVDFEVRYGTGVMLSVLNFSGTPSIGILKHTGSGYTVLDERKFTGATIPVVLSVIICNTQISNVYKLNSEDKLSFEINAGGLNLGLLGNSYASVVVRKISD